ncbi:MAG TPA: zf-HC2 domain-containing protein [bacterium]|nr:zf-HC2 domain-containing protein [bacterium]
MTAQRVEMTCQELVELVTEYLEGTLAPSERQRFEAHLGRCDGCTTYLEQMRQLIAALGRLTEESIPEQVKQDLLQAFRDWKNSAG